MKNDLNITMSNLTLSKRAKRDLNLAPLSFHYPFLFHPCVLMIIDYWGCGLYMPLMTFLFSIMHIYLHVEFFFFIYLVIHPSTYVCRGCGWKMLQCYMEATQLGNIFSWALYHTHVRVWFLLVYLPLRSSKHLKTLSCMAKCAQHFILAGCAAGILTISLYIE